MSSLNDRVSSRLDERIEPPTAPIIAVKYTDHELREFWASTGNECQPYTNARQRATPSCSLELLWQRTRKNMRDSSSQALSCGFCFSEATSDASALFVEDLEDLDRVIAKQITAASAQEEAHGSDRRIGKRTGRGMCDFLVGFQGYCQAYSGVVQLMGAIDQSFVTGAVQVLGLFMVVAVNKRETEAELHGMIESLKSQYTQIKKLEGIYSNSSALQECVANVYRLGIEFLQEATIYYSYSSWRRLWHVVARPPQLDLSDKVSALRNAMSELVAERKVEDQLRLERIETVVVSTRDQNRIERGDKRLIKIFDLLGLSLGNASNQLEGYVSLLEGTFSRLRRIPPFRPGDLTSNSQFNTWMEEPQRSEPVMFLFLHGRTVAPWNTPMSWVSQASVESVRLLKEKQAIVAWHLCKPDRDYNDAGVKPSLVPAAALVLLSLGYRLLDLTSAGRTAIGSDSTPEFERQLRNIEESARISRERIEIRSNGNRGVSSSDCSNTAMAFLRATIAAVTQHIQTPPSQPGRTTVHLVIDRFDIIPQHCTTLLEPLMDLVQKPEPGVVVKVLVVGERKLGDQKGGVEVAEFVEDHQRKPGWGEIELDQGR